MTPPAFSICIPNYNYANYIGETIQSVLNQSYPHYEIVVVDNASTDNSVEVIRSFGSDKIRLFENQYNVGFAPNLDRAAVKASNPYLIMLSSDDLMRLTALEEYARVIETLGADAERALFFSSVDIIDGQGKKTRQLNRRDFFEMQPDAQLTTGFTDPDVEGFSGLAVFKEVFPRMSVPGAFCSTLYSRRLYDSVGGYSSVNHIGPDAHFTYKSLLQNVTVLFVNKPLFAYRLHESNQLTTDRKRLTMKVPIDRYLFTLQYSDDELANAGINRDALIRSVIDESCLNGGFAALRSGSPYQAFRLWMFGFATYPGAMLRSWKTGIMGLLLLSGPAGPVIARTLDKWVKNRKHFASTRTRIHE